MKPKTDPKNDPKSILTPLPDPTPIPAVTMDLELEEAEDEEKVIEQAPFETMLKISKQPIPLNKEKKDDKDDAVVLTTLNQGDKVLAYSIGPLNGPPGMVHDISDLNLSKNDLINAVKEELHGVSSASSLGTAIEAIEKKFPGRETGITSMEDYQQSLSSSEFGLR